MPTTNGQRIFSAADFEQVLRLTREGKTVAECAAIIDFSPTTVYKAVADNDEWRAQFLEARAFAKEQKAERAETITWRVADNDKHPRQWDALSRLLNGFHPDLRDQPQRVEIGGTDKPIALEARKVVTLADLYSFAEQVGALEPDADPGTDGTLAALPPAADVHPNGDPGTP